MIPIEMIADISHPQGKVLHGASNCDELLNDPRRLAELVRERLGVERRRGRRTSTITAMIASYAAKISEDTGLKEDVARSAIDTQIGPLRWLPFQHFR